MIRDEGSILIVLFFFFFKQKTAYEMRISDWSSDVCSSDLADEEESRDLRRRWGVMFQGGALFSTLSVAENIQVPLREYYPRLDADLLDEIAAYKVEMV